MKNLSLWILSLSFCLVTINSYIVAQAPLPYEEGAYDEVPLRNREAASENIQNLRKGALLVRLKTRQNTIDAFKKKGYLKMAQQVEDEQRTSNEKLMQAFGQHFNFCKVYFFFSDDSEKVTDKDWTGFFLNTKLEKDASIILTEDFILTAELGNIVKEPATVSLSGDKFNEDSGFSESILIVKNGDFEQLQRPFPFYVKASDRFVEKKVAKLNKRLHSFHEYSSR